jgi:hypothetical protein
MKICYFQRHLDNKFYYKYVCDNGMESKAFLDLQELFAYNYEDAFEPDADTSTIWQLPIEELKLIHPELFL